MSHLISHPAALLAARRSDLKRRRRKFASVSQRIVVGIKFWRAEERPLRLTHDAGDDTVAKPHHDEMTGSLGPFRVFGILVAQALVGAVDTPSVDKARVSLALENIEIS